MRRSSLLLLLSAGSFVALACSGSGETGAGGPDLGHDHDAMGAGSSASDSGRPGDTGGSTGTAGFGGASGSGGGAGSGAVEGGSGGDGTLATGGTAGTSGGSGGGSAGGTAGASGGGASGASGGGSGATGPGDGAAGQNGAGGGPTDGGGRRECTVSTQCDDNDACNGVETCAEGLCMEGPSPSCDDSNVCTADSCDTVTGCVFSPLSGGSCDDGSACSTGDTCQSGTCVGTGQLACDDANPCTDDTCAAGSGCVHQNNTAPCDDGTACSTGDVCNGGACVATGQLACDDGNPCTADSCDAVAGCVNAPASGAACNDGNPCTATDVCNAGTCAGITATACNDGNPCTTDSCDPSIGCVSTNNASACDDGNPCTSGDVCGGGTCAGSRVSCDDGNECTADSCGASGSCQHQAIADGTTCSDDGNPCTVDTCQAGSCNTPVPAGSVQCRDPSCSGSPGSSTSAAFCSATGSCPSPVVTSCGVDPCNSAGTACQNGCALDGDCPSGFFCNATGKCVTQIPNGTACTRNAQCAQTHCVDGFCCDTACGGGVAADCQSCNVTPGTCKTLTGTSCSDGNACTSGDTCGAGVCGGGGATSCDDGNPCTVDTCDAASGCAHVASANGTSCSDGNACTGGDQCSNGVCVGGAAPSCDDGNVCTTDSCNPATGCAHANNTAACSDGNACTTGDVCSNGSCKAGAAATCSDGNSCTTDSCNPATGCAYANNTAACSDGNACTTGDTCSNGACVGGAAPSCDDANACTTDSCSPATGCVHTNNALTCNDGNACTTGDACVTGVCQGGPALTCNDGNGCTTDTCAPGSGCVFTNNSAACNDGNACTTGDVCAGGSCRSGAVVTCNDGNVCTNDSCNPSTGCSYSNNTVACSDGNACTTGDTCAGGVCVGGVGPNCNDGNPCTDDSCASGSGCVHTPNAVACNDGNACTSGDTCAGGACVGAAMTCNDGVFCNGVETCNPGTGCVAGATVTCPNTDGLDCTVEFCNESKKSCDLVAQDVRCDDKAFCNGIELCAPSNPAHDVKGCVPGAPPPCDDGLPCTTNGCDNGSAACTFTPVNALCGDGNVCNGAEVCDPQSGCTAGTPLACGDGKLCTVDSCNPITGCVYTPNNTLCQDGLYCNGTEVCSPAAPLANAAGCIGGTVVTCPPTDAVLCTQDTCNEATDSCKVVYDSSLCGGLQCTALGCGKSCTSSADCNDGLACNGVETCDLSGGSPGQCKPGIPTVCDDGKSCTVDSCQDPAGTCVFTPNDAACQNGNLCDGTETCSPAAGGANPATGCKAGTAPNCDDGVFCTTDVCSPSTGCGHFPDLGFCDDGLVCNGTELCKPSSVSPVPNSFGCIPGTPLVCPDDGIACTTDKCSEVSGGCISLADNSKCACRETCDPARGCGNFCVVSTCQGKTYQCGDCLDNDLDCGVDSLSDPECLGPCSDNESGFKGDIPGQDHGNCDADCYFDQDNGSGNDQCFWSEQCDPRSIASATPAYTPSLSNKCDYAGLSSGQSTQCDAWFSAQTATCWSTSGVAGTNYCGALVPNGCDCFGCCIIPGAPTPVFLGSADSGHAAGSCTEGTALTDPTKCHPCTQVPSCTNSCAHCELCIGKPTLPSDCECQECAPGKQLCGAPCGTPCPTGQFCLSGCCAANPK